MAFERAIEDHRAMLAARGAAAERAEPRHQLFGFERLGEIIVGAGVQAFGPFAGPPERGKHQYRRPDATFAQPPEDRQPVEVAQHPVEYDDVELLHARAQQAARAGAFPRHDIPARRREFLKLARRALVILDIQDLQRFHAVDAAIHPSETPPRLLWHTPEAGERRTGNQTLRPTHNPWCHTGPPHRGPVLLARTPGALSTLGRTRS